MKYNRYGDDFLVDKIQPEEIGEELVNVGELVADEEWQIINDSEHSLQEDYSVPEREVDLEQSEIERRENTNLRIPEWMHNLETVQVCIHSGILRFVFSLLSISLLFRTRTRSRPGTKRDRKKGKYKPEDT